jgi:hypothetical protein
MVNRPGWLARRFKWSDDVFRTVQSVVWFSVVTVVGLILIVTEEQILLTLARGDFAKADALDVFQGLTFGLVAIAAAGVLLPNARDVSE